MESPLNDKIGSTMANSSLSAEVLPRFQSTTALRRTNKNKQPHVSSNANVVVVDGTNASQDGPFPHQSTRNHKHKRGVPWTDEEHKLFLLGLRKVDKGDWRGIARDFVKTRSTTQVAAHAYKFFQRSKYKQLHESSNANVVVADSTNDSEYGPFPHPSTRNHERKRGVAWTDEEHKLFLLGLRKADKGDWRGIARDFVKTRTPTQVAAHAYKFFQQSKLLAREELPYRKSALPVAQENQPSDYTGVTGPKEIEVTSVQISAEELVFSPRKSKNLEVVENVSLEVKSDYTRPEEVLEATGFQVCPEELVSSPRKSKVLEVVENISLEVKSAYYTAPEEVKATRFQVCPEEELVTSPRKCKVLEAVENISLEIIGCCCVFCEEVMGIY